MPKDIGATLITEKNGRLVGIVSDGDLRRALMSRSEIMSLPVEEIMSPSPKTIDEDQTAGEALALMELHLITHLVIVDMDSRIRGVVHLHDLLGREEFRFNGGLCSSKGTHR